MTTNNLHEELLDLAGNVEAGNVTAVQNLTGVLLEKGVGWEKILNEGLLPGIDRVREKFDQLEAFLPDMVFASDAIHAGVEKIKNSIPESDRKKFQRGTVVIGTVKGDIHDVGKTIVATLLAAFGFEVYDLGIDVSSEAFIDRAKDLKADLIYLSCLMTTALARQREVIEDLVRLGLRDQFKVFVGGGAVTTEWARQVGADGYGSDANEAVELAMSYVMKDRGKS
jgi:methylmalonyl-CoA mutase cobalamin-binding domain/chain